MRLENKIAMVSGGGAGIGEGIVMALAQEGANIAVCDISKERAEGVAAKVNALGRKAIAIPTNAMDSKQVAEAAKKVVDTFGRIDILVNNVGGEARFYKPRTGSRFLEIEEQEWNDNIELNLKTTIIACQQVAPYMAKQKYGKIVNIASGAGRHPSWSGTRSAITMAYGVCKAGVIQLTGLLAMDLSEFNINVNCVCPSSTWSPMMEKNCIRAMGDKPEYKGMTPREYFLKVVVPRNPLGRELTADDIGKAVLFFASEDAKNITGQSLNVNGGVLTS